MLAALLVATAACSDDGRTLRPPGPGQTTTTTSAPTVGTAADAAVFDLVGPFGDGAQLPIGFTCDSPTSPTSPPLGWTGVPAGTVELALTVIDPDAEGFVHWAVAGIDPASTGVGGGPLPAGAVEALNSTGAAGWTPACPPPGATHQYVFTLYAVPKPLALAPGTPAQEAVQTMQAAAGSAAVLTGLYTRP